LIRERLVDPELLKVRLTSLSVPAEQRARLLRWVARQE
jgi:hypothetical protein